MKNLKDILSESILDDMETTLKVTNKKALDAIIKLPKKSDFEKENVMVGSYSGKRVYAFVLKWPCEVLIGKYVNELQNHSLSFRKNCFEYLRFQIMDNFLSVDFVDKNKVKSGLFSYSKDKSLTGEILGYTPDQLKTIAINICKKLRENPECITDLINHANNGGSTKNVKEIFNV